MKESAAFPRQTAPDAGCMACHSCPKPEPSSLCLRSCARTDQALPANPLRAPDVIILDELKDRYLPVPFDHKGHSSMAAMGKGCSICHHHTPEGLAYPACKSCHDASPQKSDISKPGLKGAYHRQCLNCHREWDGESKCETCHRTRSTREGEGRAMITPDDALGRMHPPIREPDTEVFNAGSSKAGTKVYFHHREHTQRFGLACTDCHHEDSCSRCHSANAPSERVRSVDEHHQPCMQCHETNDNNRCDRCHRDEGLPPPSRFEHLTVGFELKPYHERGTCRVCHSAVPFVKLDRDCRGCHKEWNSTFDHRVTGQILDDNHSSIDCATCHAESRFDRAPTCTDCHEEKEGVSFPNRRPGPVQKP